nr:MAG TPA: hypothetical protein [Caudoviricetes sp.]
MGFDTKEWFKNAVLPAFEDVDDPMFAKTFFNLPKEKMFEILSHGFDMGYIGVKGADDTSITFMCQK